MYSCKKFTIYNLLMNEIFKTIHDENPQFMREVFVREDTRYDIRCEFKLNVRTLVRMDYAQYLSGANNFGIRSLIMLKIYQVCPYSRTK